MPSKGKGVSHARSTSLPAVKSPGARSGKGSGGKGVSHARKSSLPPRKHSFGDANGGHAGSVKGRMARDDAARHKV